VGQYAKVKLSPTKTEIGVIESLDDTNATLAMTSGFTVTYPRTKLLRTALVILDLNGVIGYRKRSKRFRRRPHLDELLSFIFKHFVVGVWTSAPEHNGLRIIEECFGPYEPRLVLKLYRDACTPNVTASNQFGTLKDLRRVWERFSQSFDETNTIMIDDSEDKCSHRQNTLVPTPYRGESFDLEGSDDEAVDPDSGLKEILSVLSRVAEQDSMDPLREHMLAKWHAQLAERASKQHDDSDGDGSSRPSLTPPSIVSRSATPPVVVMHQAVKIQDSAAHAAVSALQAGPAAVVLPVQSEPSASGNPPLTVKRVEGGAILAEPRSDGVELRARGGGGHW
jgi:hypothetical protein